MARSIAIPAARPRLTRHGLLALIALGWLLSAWVATAEAQLPVTSLSNIFPAGGKQGSEFEVTINGADLDDVDQLIFSHAGITAAPKMAEPTEFDMGPQQMPNKFTVKVAGDVPLGIYEVRAVGRFGVSNPRGFAVGNLPETEDDGQNKSYDKARLVELGTLVNGRVDANSVDYYKLALKKGQRVIVDCVAQRIDSRMDSSLMLFDPDGGETLRVRDVMLNDAVLDYTAPADGEYTIGVYDYVYGGGADYFYRLAIHSGPYVDFVFPPSGLGGSNDKYTVYGRNLPGSKPAEGLTVEGQQLEQVSVNIALPGDDISQRQLEVGALAEPRSALVDGFEYRFPSANPVRISYARAKVAAEQEPNDKVENVQTVQAPCEFVGQFYPERDADRLQFEAKAGDVYNIEVIGHRIGLVKCDPYLLIERVTKNDKGEETITRVAGVDDPSDRNTRIGSDFDTSTDDPFYRLEVTQDAVYRILVTDNFSSTIADPRNVYRLTIRKGDPDFRLVAVPEGEPQANANIVAPASTVLRKGGAATLEVTVDRRDGFVGEIEIGVEGLPKGVSCPGALVGGDIDKAKLVLTAAEDAPAWAGAIKIFGKAKIDDKEALRYARAGSVVWGTTNRTTILPEFRLTRDIAISVVESDPAPAFVTVGDPAEVHETSLGGKLEIPVKINRRGDFKLDVKLSAAGLPTDFKLKDVTIKGADGEGKLEIDINNTKIKPGSYTFYLQGTAAKYKYARNPESIAAAEAEKKHIDEVAKKLADELKAATAAKEKDDAKIKELQDKVKLADQKKKDVDKKIADLKKANAPKDINLTLASTPIKLRINESPLKIDAAMPGALKQGEKLELPVKLEKLYGFDEKVDISLEAPKGVSGVSVKNVSIDKGQAEAKLELTAAANATPGEHKFIVHAKVRYNNFNIDETYEVAVKVDEVKKEEAKK